MEKTSKKRHLSLGEKIKAVQMLDAEGLTETKNVFGVSATTVYRWKRELGTFSTANKPPQYDKYLRRHYETVSAAVRDLKDQVIDKMIIIKAMEEAIKSRE